MAMMAMMIVIRIGFLEGDADNGDDDFDADIYIMVECLYLCLSQK